MPHPLAPDMSKLGDEELHNKITELNGKFRFAMRTNKHLADQIYFLLEDYEQEYYRRLHEKDKEVREEMGEDFFSDKIDIQ